MSHTGSVMLNVTLAWYKGVHIGETDGLARIDATSAHFEDSLVPEEENPSEEASNLHHLRSIKQGNAHKQ